MNLPPEKGENEQEVTRKCNGHGRNWKDVNGQWQETKLLPPVGTLPKSLGACENVSKKHILLILLFADYGNGPTSSLERILTGHGKDMERTCDMKEKEVDAHVTKWNDKAGNDNKSKTIPEGLENSSYYHYPLTNHVFGLLSKNALVSQERNIVFKFGFWEIFPFKMTWQEKMKWQGNGKTWRERTWKQLKRHELDSLASEFKGKERQRQ